MATFAPHVERSVIEINNRFPALGKGGTYPGHGEDGSQYAADFWSTNKGVHDAVLKFVIAHHKRLGVKYIITWERIWSDSRSDEGIRRYRRDANSDGVLTASERHTNHVHISFNVDPPEEEDMPTAKEIANELTGDKTFLAAVARAVWNADVIPNPNPENPEIQAKNMLVEIRNDTEEILDKLDS